MRPAIYLINGMTCVLVLTVVLAFVPSDVDEPYFSRPVAAALYGAAMLFALGLTALPIVLCRRQNVDAVDRQNMGMNIESERRISPLDRRDGPGVRVRDAAESEQALGAARRRAGGPSQRAWRSQAARARPADVRRAAPL